MIQTKVHLETGEQRRECVRGATEALGEEFFGRIHEAERIMLKVNLVHHENQLASTHVDAVRGFLDGILGKTKARILIADASYHGTSAAFRNFGYARLQKEYDRVELVDLNEDDVVDAYTVRRDGSQNPIRRSKLAMTADVVVSLAPMKMHRDTLVTLAIKSWTIGTWIVPSRNSAGGRVWARWPWLHDEGARAHHASIMELYRQKPCDYAIVDGMVAMEGDGPTRGRPVEMNVVLSGNDAVAVDAVSATLMGVDPGEVGYLAMCQEEGLGVSDLGLIDVPPMLMAQLRKDLEKPPGFETLTNNWKN